MTTVEFYDLNEVENNKLKFAVIMAKYKDRWIFVRHRERLTWEIPGGHREIGEDINKTASRELIEETGADKFNIVPICIYSVIRDGIETFGQLFYSEVESFLDLPDYEIAEIKLFDKMPDNLTYTSIQPYLFEKVNEYIKNI